MLVLSLFPGIGLLDRAFEEEWPEICLVRGPDLLWGGDVRTFHVPVGKFDGVIGGDPCQAFSPLRHMVAYTHGESAVADNLLPEYERIVREAQPSWFLRENSPFAPDPMVPGYQVHRLVLNNRWLGEVQNRKRAFWFGTRDGQKLTIDVALFESPQYERCVIANGAKEGAVIRLDRGGRTRPARKQTLPGNLPRRSVQQCCELQGLPPDFLDKAPFTVEGKYRVIGNGVPLPMGRAIARAVKQALETHTVGGTK